MRLKCQTDEITNIDMEIEMAVISEPRVPEENLQTLGGWYPGAGCSWKDGLRKYSMDGESPDQVERLQHICKKTLSWILPDMKKILFGTVCKEDWNPILIFCFYARKRCTGYYDNLLLHTS